MFRPLKEGCMRPRFAGAIAGALVVLFTGPTAHAEPRVARARPNRVAATLGFGFGSASLDRLGVLATDVAQNVRASSPGLTLGTAPTSGTQINAQLGVRYYGPFHLLADLGYGTLYNFASAAYSAGPVTGAVTSDTLVMEVPLLVGGYYTLFERLYLCGALGPSFYVFPRSFWETDHGGLPDYKADGGVGFGLLVGGDYLLGENVALGLEVRYRYLKTGPLKERESGVEVTSGMLRQDASVEHYDLDFSGVSVGLSLKLFAL
jgi:opacity protein-like surface antigen